MIRSTDRSSESRHRRPRQRDARSKGETQYSSNADRPRSYVVVPSNALQGDRNGALQLGHQLDILGCYVWSAEWPSHQQSAGNNLLTFDSTTYRTSNIEQELRVVGGVTEKTQKTLIPTPPVPTSRALRAQARNRILTYLNKGADEIRLGELVGEVHCRLFARFPVSSQFVPREHRKQRDMTEKYYSLLIPADMEACPTPFMVL